MAKLKAFFFFVIILNFIFVPYIKISNFYKKKSCLAKTVFSKVDFQVLSSQRQRASVNNI